MTIPGPRTVLEVAAGLGPADREAVVLGGHEHAPPVEVEHRVVGAAVAEPQLERLEPQSTAEQLVPQADPEHRPRLEHGADLGDARRRAAGSPGPLASRMPSGEAASTSSAGASQGMTVTLAPASRRRRTIEPFTP